MKRFFILASAAIVALASCAKTEVLNNDTPQEIAFKQVTGAMTKADEPTALTTDMGVFAYTSEGDAYFVDASSNAEPKQFAKGTTYWEANPKQYYPMQTALDFACYSPYAAGWTYNNGTQTMTSKAFTADEIKVTDVLFGAEVYDGCTDDVQVVSVLFKHALAQVSVSVKTNVPDDITITKVTLEKVNRGGTLIVDYESTKLNTVSWDNVTPADYSWSGFTSPTTTDAVSCGDAYYFIANNYKDDDPAPDGINDYANGCPQTKFVVDYTMNGVEFSAEVSLTGAYWEMGKHYKYTISANLVEIQFDPKVEVMATVTPEAIAL